ncbi:MAG: anhydro-N-acetylmuramic acid kinase, partial [Calditrichaeota bacterium]|nr:anhydro-N-acetylmuramic acid kinase [Calditrichota bacterium]
IMNLFKKAGYTIRNISENEADFKEAVFFARLAFNFISSKTSNLASVTGALSETVLGILAVP